jgi:hypothetical protein
VQGGIERVVEDDDVAAGDSLSRHEKSGIGGVDLLVNQEEVADEEGGLHALGWDAEGLEGEGHDEERDDQNVEQRLDGREDAYGMEVLGRFGWSERQLWSRAWVETG